MQELRETYGLQAIAEDGTDEERAILLMHWVHDLTRHAINPSTPTEMTALNLIRLCQQEGKRINCWMYATILNECLLSVGLSSRLVHLSPPKVRPKESHFVTAVYLQDAEKWIMLDPDMSGWFVDEDGLRLGIPEIRERLISSIHLQSNDAVAIQGFNWLPSFLRKAIYKAYISKNLFRVACSRKSVVGITSQRVGRVTYELIPDGDHPEWLKEPRVSRGNAHVYTNNPDLFWQALTVNQSMPLMMEETTISNP